MERRKIPASILTIKFGLKRHIKCCKDYSLPSSVKAVSTMDTRGDHGAGVDSGRSLRFLPKPEQDPESDFWMKSGPGVRISVLTGVG